MSDTSPASRRDPGHAAEPRYRDGSVMLWPAHLAILQGLLDRPGGTAASRNDCTDAARPHLRRLEGAVTAGIYYRIPQLVRYGWIDRKRAGRCIEHSLTARGREIANGDVVARVRGRFMFIPGWRPPREGSPVAPGTVACLGYGISMTVPWPWSASTPAVERALRAGHGAVNGALEQLPGNGCLLALWPPAAADPRPALAIMVLPTRLTQDRCAALRDDEIAAHDADGIRPECERATAYAGFRISRWEGTARAMVGRRFGLVTRYAIEHEGGQRLRKEAHVAYLGAHQVVVHCFLPDEPGSPVESDVRGMLESLRIAGSVS